jgi:hypothetical protein
VELTGRLGALAERNFRLVFSSTSISALGDGVSTVALAFAVLHIGGSATALGLVIAGRQGAAAAITVAAGEACFAVIISQRSVWGIRSGMPGWESGAEAAA